MLVVSQIQILPIA